MLRPAEINRRELFSRLCSVIPARSPLPPPHSYCLVNIQLPVFRLMEAGHAPLEDATWALIQTLPVNDNIHQELESMGGRCAS